MVLNTNIDGKVETFNVENVGIGDTGITLGRLAPSGKVKVNGETVDALSTGSFIDPHQQVRIVKILPNKIIVELIKNE